MMTGTDSHTLLLVEDDRDTARLLDRVLSPLGYQVTIAPSGEQALDLATQQQFDLVLLDLMLPVMNGFEVCRRLRTNTATMRLPIIIITAYDTAAARNSAEQLGVEDYLVKPVHIDQLPQHLEAALRISQLTECARWIERSCCLLNKPAFVTDLEGNIAYCNARAAAIFGEEPDALLKRSLHYYTPSDERPLLEQALAQLREVGHWEGAVILEHRDRTQFVGQISASVIRQDDGSSIGMLLLLN